MARSTGTCRIWRTGEEGVRAFIPANLPPARPPLVIEGSLANALARADHSMGRLAVAADLVPNAEWFLYGFVRKEALITSQIEGTQATLRDVLTFEAGEHVERPEDAREVCNYVD